MKTEDNTGEMTSKAYWDSRQFDSPIKSSSECAKENEWSLDFAEIVKQDLNNGRMLEIGCNPGYASLAILNYISMEANGVDFNQHDKSFIENVTKNGYQLGDVHISDVRAFSTNSRYDLVFSCGFVEHFDKFQEMVKIHKSFAKEGGYILIVVPNFRYIQWVYHKIFDKTDLLKHNIKSMDISAIEQALSEDGLEIIKSGYSGRMRFWNYDSSGGIIMRAIIRFSSKLVRILASFISIGLPKNNQFYSPWIYVVAKK